MRERNRREADGLACVPEPKPSALSLSLDFFGEDVLIILRSEPGYSYQLRAATTLSAPDWTNVGTPAAGVGGLLALPHPQGRQGDRRFYNIGVSPKG